MYVLGVEGKCSGLDGSGRDGGWTLRDAAGTCSVAFAAQLALLSGLSGRLTRSNSARNPLPRTGSSRRFRLTASLAIRLRSYRSHLAVAVHYCITASIAAALLIQHKQSYNLRRVPVGQTKRQ